MIIKSTFYFIVYWKYAQIELVLRLAILIAHSVKSVEQICKINSGFTDFMDKSWKKEVA